MLFVENLPLISLAVLSVISVGTVVKQTISFKKELAKKDDTIAVLRGKVEEVQNNTIASELRGMKVLMDKDGLLDKIADLNASLGVEKEMTALLSKNLKEAETKLEGAEANVAKLTKDNERSKARIKLITTKSQELYQTVATMREWFEEVRTEKEDFRVLMERVFTHSKKEVEIYDNLIKMADNTLHGVNEFRPPTVQEQVEASRGSFEEKLNNVKAKKPTPTEMATSSKTYFAWLRKPKQIVMNFITKEVEEEVVVPEVVNEPVEESEINNEVNTEEPVEVVVGTKE